MALSASDLPAMYLLLSNSLSGDQTVRKSAEKSLSQSENRPGFCSCLMEVIAAKDLVSQVDIRLLASVYFKNSINRYWRNRRNSPGISSEEKIHLRRKLLSHLREENQQIALMLAVLISKIARIDYPREWSDLFTILAQSLQSADILTSHRIFLILFRTLKQLSTKRLASDQQIFAEISSHFFDYSWQLWQNDVQNILHGFSSIDQSFNSNAIKQQHDDLYVICERWLLCTKILRQFIIFGFPSDAKCIQDISPVKETSPAFLNAIRLFLPYHSSFHSRHPKFSDFSKRACTKLIKVLVAVQGRHPYSFGDKCVLPLIMDFCLTKIINIEVDAVPFEQFLIHCMIIVKSILECKEYKPTLTGCVMDENGITIEKMKKNLSSVIGGILASILSNERVVQLCNILIRRYFVLTADDMEEWVQNPELFHHEQDMVQWSEKLRPCAEALYIVLFENHSQLLGPAVVSILQEAMNNCPSLAVEITPSLLLKEAAYGATVYVHYELSNYLNFNDWFNGAISLELANDHPNMRIIHRKIALILGQWVSEIKDDTKRQVYCSLIRLLQEEDLSVRLAACRSLFLLIEDANFSERSFIDLLPLCWDLCIKLFDDVQEFDSKVQVMNSMSVLLGHFSEIISFANKLGQFFLKVWVDSSGESLLRIQLLIALRNFVVALSYQSPICYNSLLPILQEGIDINNPDEMSLLEDSMMLWEAILSYAPSMMPQLLAFFPYIVEILERNLDHLQVAVTILEDYIILGGNEFLNTHASNVVKFLDIVVGSVNDKGLLSVLPVIELLIQCYPMEVPPMINSTLQKLVVICLRERDERDPSNATVKASSASILARILVTNSNYIAQLTSEPELNVKAGLSSEGNVLLCLVDIWLDKVDNVSSLKRKAYGLALSIILTLRLPQVLDKLDLILGVCTSLILGVKDEEESSGESTASSRPCDESAVPTMEFRRRQIKLRDPIKQLNLETSVRQNLQTCAAFHGESFNSVINRMHPSALAQLKQALKMP